MIKKARGITMIVLVITIIVLIILAGVTISVLTGDNGIITKAIESAFRKEMAEMKDQVDLQLINCEMYGEEIQDKFAQVKLEDAKKWDDYLKLELIFWGEYEISQDITTLTADYVKANQDEILEENTEEVNGIKYV